MAYAEVAGLPLVNDLYALLLPTVLFAVLGSSRQVILGPEGSIATLVAAAVLPLGAAILALSDTGGTATVLEDPVARHRAR